MFIRAGSRNVKEG